MKHIRKFKFLKSLAGLAPLTAIVVATLMTTSQPVSAWGPERPTYTNAVPADYATFNSITDNVAVGDERNFVRIRDLATEEYYSDETKIIPGHEYEVYIYYHNDAASNTNESGFGIATNTRVASGYPTLVSTGSRYMVSGIITWSYVTPEDPNNARLGKVWDEAYVTSDYDNVVLRYKTGSAKIHNSGQTNGSTLSTNLFSQSGTPIGFNKLAGTVPGCAEYSGHITYTLVAENPGSELTKKVSTDGKNWYDSVTVEPGEFVTYKVAFRNTGNTDFTNAIFTDSHDSDLLLRAGSTKFYDYKNVNGYQIADIIDISGHNAGDMYAGALVQAVYQMQVRNDRSMCGRTLQNTMTVRYNNSADQKQDTATVKVACKDDPPTTEDCTTNPDLPGCSTRPDCKDNPTLPGCNVPNNCEIDPTLDGCTTPVPEDCTTNPNLAGCVEPTPENCFTNPDMPGCTPYIPPEPTDDCTTNPNLPECQRIPETGPREIILAVVVALAILAVGFYFWRTHRTLKTVETVVSGPTETKKTDEPKQAKTEPTSQPSDQPKPDNSDKQ